jgi:phosphatidylserine/phosphatidylglycerophosphate/cardiolipin synthase-like enzyme
MKPELAAWLLPERSGDDAWRTVRTDEFARSGAPFEFYTDYGLYYSRLAEVFAKTNGKDDQIFIVGWRFHSQQQLRPGMTALKSLQQAAQNRKVTVRLLITAGIEDKGLRERNESEVKAAQAAGLNALLDEQYISPCNFHQKAIYVKTGSDSFLFVGGMDIAQGLVGNWFDVQAEITGNAAELGRFTLEERWTSVTDPKATYQPVFKRNPPGSDHTLVQFLRNYGKPDQHATTAGRKYAPDGDYTYRELLAQAISNSKKFIYLEDQFFYRMGTANWSLDPLLRAAALRNVHVIVVSNRPDDLGPDGPKLRPPLIVDLVRSSYDLRYIHLLQLNASAAKTRYVHTKTWIFDDELAVVGSANYWDRSMTCEAEFGVAMAGEWQLSRYPGMAFAKGLRKQMWDSLLAQTGGKLDKTPAATFLQDLAVLTGNQSPLEPQVAYPGPPSHALPGSTS